MSETSDKAKAKLEAARQKAEKLRAMQEEAAREIAAAEALEAEESSEREVLRAQRAKERLHRAAEKQRLRQQQKAAALVKETNKVNETTGSRRKRIGLKCFNCNRLEGHYLLFYRRLWYSYLIGLTFGLAVIAGPYRCQCCGSSRFMMSNLLHPKYYLSLLSTRSKSRSSSRSSRR